jgi:pimeloyl-ACP methyl ester carboxylesterase
VHTLETSGSAAALQLFETQQRCKIEMFDHQHGDYFENDGARIYFEIRGDDDAPPLLLLHGGFGTLEDFNAIAPALSPQFRLVAMDGRGHGKSTLGSRPLSYEQLQLDALALLEHLDIETAYIIGFSDGGIAAYRIGAFECERVEKLVTIGAAWERRPDDPANEILSKVTGESWRKKFPETYAIYQKYNPEPDFDGLARAAVSMWLDPSDSGYPNQAARSICCPLLIIRGENDHLFAKEDAAELQHLVNGSRLEMIANAGHEAHKDQSDAVVKLIQQFFGA